MQVITAPSSTFADALTLLRIASDPQQCHDALENLRKATNEYTELQYDVARREMELRNWEGTVTHRDQVVTDRETAVTVREAAVSQREEAMSVRETDRERGVAGREAAVGLREQDVTVREQRLEESRLKWLGQLQT